MLDEAEYASDTDESDDDYKPDGEGSDVASEESEAELENDDIETEGKQSHRKRSAPKQTLIGSKRGRRNEEPEKKTLEKDSLDDEDENSNEDALWASFLSNAGQTATKPANPKPNSNPANKTTTTTSNGSSKQLEMTKPPKSTEQKKIVTEVFEFAGEKVEVQKEIIVDVGKTASANHQIPSTDSSVKSNSNTATTAGHSAPGKAPTIPSLQKPRASAGGISSVLGQIGKKNKLSILQKSQLDWTGFKRNEGIDEDLQTHNKGRDGYLERQDFLQRTDLRRFEIEKNMRHANRRK